MIYDFTAGDTGAKIRAAMINATTGKRIVPFSGLYTAVIVVRPQGGAAVSRTMTLLTGTDDGYAEYLLAGSELVEGTLETQVRITRVSDGLVVSELQITEWQVGPRLE